MPISHGDGRYTADSETVDRLEGEGRVVFRYLGGPADADEWWSPNGSMRAIAAVLIGLLHGGPDIAAGLLHW